MINFKVIVFHFPVFDTGSCNVAQSNFLAFKKFPSQTSSDGMTIVYTYPTYNYFQ